MNGEKKLRSLGAVLIVLVFSVASADALERWENVLERGFDDPRMREAQAMAIYGSHVYAASFPESDSPHTEHARILRATLPDDDVWIDFTPVGGLPLASPITDMVAFNGRLFVSVSDQLWSLSDPSNILTWTRVDLPAPRPILALGTVIRADTRRRMLCLLRGTSDAQTLCFFEDLDRWHEFPFPSTARPTTVGFASLKGQGQLLWASLNGTTRGNGPCVVGTYSNFRVSGGLPEVGSMDALTEDCFGTGVDFVEMEIFRDTPYFGIAGGGGGGSAASDFRILRLNRGAGTPRDVTPWELFCPALGGARCDEGVLPAAVGSIAVSGSGLYMGIRLPFERPRDAVVIFTGDGDHWTQSNEPGFGRDFNANVSAMTGRGCALYAGTHKVSGAGFEVWRRGLFVAASVHCIEDIERNVWRELQGIQRCLARVVPSVPPQFEVICLPDFLRLVAFFEDIDWSFARAVGENPREEILIEDMRKMLNRAFLELEKAKELVAQADLEKSPGAARKLGQQAILHVREAAHIAHKTVVSFKTALKHGGGKGVEVIPQEPPLP